jgi:hypothetical protein
MAVQIQLRRDTAANWTSANPTLAAGEFAIETDTDKYKIGDGSTAWTSLGYSSLPSGTATLASPTFTGVPAAPTASANTNTTQVATTAFVMTEVGDYLLTATAGSTYLPLAGGTLSGAVNAGDQVISKAVFKDVGETLVVNGTSGSTDTIDLEDGNFHKVTLTANCTFTFSNPPASGTAGSFTLFLIQDGTGSRTVTWPGTVDWAAATAPTLTTTAAAVDVLTFITLDGGTIWNGFVAGQAMG